MGKLASVCVVFLFACTKNIDTNEVWYIVFEVYDVI